MATLLNRIKAMELLLIQYALNTWQYNEVYELQCYFLLYFAE